MRQRAAARDRGAGGCGDRRRATEYDDDHHGERPADRRRHRDAGDRAGARHDLRPLRGRAARWITVYTNPGHAFVEVAGLRLDTSAAEDPTGRKGPEWRPVRHAHGGFRARHPVGF